MKAMENHKRGQANERTDDNNVTVHVPMTFRNRGGCKLVVVPRDAPQRSPQRSIENPLAKVIVRAFHWKRLLEAGEYTTLAELAAVESIDKSNLSKALRLTLLAPDIVEAILDGTEHGDLQIERLLKPFPVEWEEQRQLLIGAVLP
jgi:hypothetical protein